MVKELEPSLNITMFETDVRKPLLLRNGVQRQSSQDRRMGVLGASPGASTAASIAVGVLEKCFASKLTESSWLPKLKEIIPTYGIDLTEDAAALRKTRAETAAILKVENI